MRLAGYFHLGVNSKHLDMYSLLFPDIGCLMCFVSALPKCFLDWKKFFFTSKRWLQAPSLLCGRTGQKKKILFLEKRNTFDEIALFLRSYSFTFAVLDAHRELVIGLFAWDFLIAKFVAGLCGNVNTRSNFALSCAIFLSLMSKFNV